MHPLVAPNTPLTPCHASPPPKRRSNGSRAARDSSRCAQKAPGKGRGRDAGRGAERAQGGRGYDTVGRRGRSGTFEACPRRRMGGCSMISERCACGCDSFGHTVSARREDRSHARGTSAQGQAGRRGITPPTRVLQGLVFLRGCGHGRIAQGRGRDEGFGWLWVASARSKKIESPQRRCSAHLHVGAPRSKPSRRSLVSDFR